MWVIHIIKQTKTENPLNQLSKRTEAWRTKPLTFSPKSTLQNPSDMWTVWETAKPTSTWKLSTSFLFLLNWSTFESFFVLSVYLSVDCQLQCLSHGQLMMPPLTRYCRSCWWWQKLKQKAGRDKERCYEVKPEWLSCCLLRNPVYISRWAERLFHLIHKSRAIWAHRVGFLHRV